MIGELLVSGGWRVVIEIHSIIGICMAVIERVLPLYMIQATCMTAWSRNEWGLMPICIFVLGKRGPGGASLARRHAFIRRITSLDLPHEKNEELTLNLDLLSQELTRHLGSPVRKGTLLPFWSVTAIILHVARDAHLNGCRWIEPIGCSQDNVPSPRPWLLHI